MCWLVTLPRGQLTYHGGVKDGMLRGWCRCRGRQLLLHWNDPKPHCNGAISMKEYWRFYWPLAVTGVAMVVVVQFQNAALARYPQAATEIAIFALSYSTFALFRAGLNFVAQLSNVYGRSAHGIRLTRRFVLAVSTLSALLLLVAGLSAPGGRLVQAVYNLDQALLLRVQEYFVYLAPMLLLDAQRFFLNGLLIQARLTGRVTLLNMMGLAVTISGLLLGLSLGLRPVQVLVGAEFAGALLQVLAMLWVKGRYYQMPQQQEHHQLRYVDLTRFFIPVATTGLMFALSRPVLYAAVSRMEEGLLYIAAMRLAFDFSQMFQQAANQFRHFFVTFGLSDLRSKRRFLLLIWAGLTLLMCLLAFTPAVQWIWLRAMGIPADLIAPAAQVLMVLCLMPGIILLRNYFHGILMVERRTGSMAYASILRVLGIYGVAQALVWLGWLDHVAAAWTLLGGFLIEALVVAYSGRRYSSPGR